MISKPFWKNKKLDEFSEEEWEALCDGCGRCCLVKLEDFDTGEIENTSVVCEFMDQGTCRCTTYETRQMVVPTCIKVTPQNVAGIEWMPPTCAYRRVAEGKDLEWWHPLVAGEHESIITAGISVKGRVISEAEVSDDDLEDHVAEWPADRGFSE